MRVIAMLFKRSCFACILAALLGILGGCITVLLLAVINRILEDGTRSVIMALLFVGLCIVRLLAGAISHIVIVQLSAGATHDMSLHLVEQMLKAPLDVLEKMGPPRLMAAFTRDVSKLSEVVITLPYQLVNVIIILSCMIYFGFSSWQICLGILLFTALGVLSFSLPSMFARRSFYLGREETDSLFKHFRSTIEGAKELKLHRSRREIFMQHVLRKSVSKVKGYMVKGISIYAVASHWNRLLFFIYVGLVLFVMPFFFEIGIAQFGSYILVLLYMMAPLEAIQNALPTLSQAEVALKKLESLGLSFSEESVGSNHDLSQNVSHTWRMVRLKKILYSYPASGERDLFKLGPISLTFNRGEIVFIIGDNGSGKSTLAKVLVGLYKPEAGDLYLDDMPIIDDNVELYRQQFTAVFQDFWLFESLLGLEGNTELDRDAARWIERLQLQKNVKVKKGVFSTIELSHGQRKRLALLVGLMEDRPFYVFDEWASDQDPAYKQVFYEEILPSLKRQGKAILVITHDDRYWHIADRLVKLDFGQISNINLFANVIKGVRVSTN